MFKIQRHESDQYRTVEIENTVVAIPTEHANTVAAAQELYGACVIARGIISAVLSCSNALENRQMLKTAKIAVEDALNQVEEMEKATLN